MSLRSLGALSVWALLALGSTLAEAQEAEGDSGIAARYPGDVGIEGDSDVVFVEDFEATLPEILGHWEDVTSEGSMSLEEDVPAGSSGAQSLLMHKTPGDGTTGAALYRRILPDGGDGYERLYARMYVKIGADADVIHHFGTNLGGNNPATQWPMVSAGNRTDGDSSFWTGIEPYGDAWHWDFYTYWVEMRSWENDDGSGDSCYGNAFLRDTADGDWEPIGPSVRRGEWVSIELMVQVNDLGQSNGEQAFWIDGQLIRDGGQVISHLGPGYPNGSWLRDKWSPDPAGEPFEGFRWRTAAELLVNYVWLYVYTEEDGYDIPVWYDDVVVAQSYIGPLFTGSSGSGGAGGVGGGTSAAGTGGPGGSTSGADTGGSTSSADTGGSTSSADTGGMGGSTSGATSTAGTTGGGREDTTDSQGGAEAEDISDGGVANDGNGQASSGRSASGRSGAGAVDAADEGADDGGCGCAVVRTTDLRGSLSEWFAVAVILVLGRRRRRNAWRRALVL